MNEVISRLEIAIRQFWPDALMLRRNQSRLGEPSSYWFLLEPGSRDLIRVFPGRDRATFYLSCFQCTDKDMLAKFIFDLERFGSDMLMLPYSTQNLEVLLTGDNYLIRNVGTVARYETLLLANGN
ncbi:hypothetical protein [Dyadobacter sandarakinus]|uniref:Uncharacterized protein n=1 Tax=Dyadobacter sandarakinus TaxID=2747268 RepID=A0ABX7I5U9_9BACT|nr:hypothetical protein [Dyadobacter sandarakinus]QRR01474.1 hypothetical protein HWI92_11445 [Dyadobacter sandarakinus]